MFYPDFVKKSLVIAMASVFATSVVADEQAKEKEDIEHIEVWSTEIKTSSLYLNGDYIVNKQADHVSDLLRSLPGVDVGGAHSLNQAITIRGLDDRSLNISIDGATQNSYMYHHMGNLQIHADILKSVDISVGNNSVVYGGLGGGVRFETKTAKDLLTEGQSVGGRVQLSYGDNSGTNYSATGFGQITDAVDFLAYYNKVDRDNFEVGGGEIKDHEGNIVSGSDGTVRGLEGELDDALIKFGWDINNNQRVSLGYESYTDEGDYSFRPDMGLATDVLIADKIKELWGAVEVPLTWPTEFTRETVTLNYDLVWGEASQLKATVFSNTSELTRDESDWGLTPGWEADALINTGEAKNSGVNVIAETSIVEVGSMKHDHDLTYGFDFVEYETEYLSQPVYDGFESVSAGEESASIAVYLQDKITLNDQFTLIPGVRYQSVDVDATVVDKTFDDTTFAFAAEYQPSENVLFKISTTEVFKAPEIAEVFIGAGGNDLENQEIEAETGSNNEFAVAYLFNGFSLGATYFETEIEDYIYEYNWDAEQRGYLKDNVGDMDIDGFETYFGYQQGGFTGQITYSQSESNLDANEDYLSLDGSRLWREQGDTYTGDIQYVLEEYNLTLHWDVTYVDSMPNTPAINGATKDTSKDSYTLHNISASWKPKSIDGLTILFGVDNLFDEYYAAHASRTGVSEHPRFGDLYLLDYEPGRNIKTTVSYSF